MLRFVILSIVACCVQAANAATLESMTIERMASEATAVVRGTVGASRVGRFGALVYTLSRFEVAEAIKGTPPGRLEVALPGGTVGALTQRFSGVPQLAEGQEYLAFLWTGPSGRTQIVGFGQGLFEIHRDGDRVEARRAPLDEGVTLLSSPEAVSEDQRFDLDVLISRIAAAVSSKGEAPEGAGR